MEDRLKLYSMVKGPLLRKKLLRGTLYAVLGISLLIFAGLFIRVELMNKWGWLIFVSGLAFVAGGLMPYRRLSKMQDSPHELIIDAISISLQEGGKLRYTIPIACLERWGHLDGQSEYGVCLWFKKPLPERVRIFDRRLRFHRMTKRSCRRQGCDLFIPYFSRRSYSQLADILEEDVG